MTEAFIMLRNELIDEIVNRVVDNIKIGILNKCFPNDCIPMYSIDETREDISNTVLDELFDDFRMEFLDEDYNNISDLIVEKLTELGIEVDYEEE